MHWNAFLDVLMSRNKSRNESQTLSVVLLQQK